MAKKETEQTMQWPKKKQDRQCNGQKRTYNAMAKKGHTMQWLKKDTKRQTMFDKTLHIKLKIEQYPVRTPQKTGVELGCSRRVSSACPTRGTVVLVL